MKKQNKFKIAVTSVTIILMMVVLLLVTAVMAQVSTEVPSDVSDALTEKGFSSATIKEVDCNTGSAYTKCFALTNGVLTYNLINMNVMTCKTPEMIRTSVAMDEMRNGKMKKLTKIIYKKTGRCMNYIEIPQRNVLEILSKVAEKKLVEIADVKPVITNPPKTYPDVPISVTKGSGGLEEI